MSLPLGVLAKGFLLAAPSGKLSLSRPPKAHEYIGDEAWTQT